MRLKKYLKSFHGFSLPEVMLALGLLGAIALGVAKMMETSTKAAKNIENKDEITHMTREISDILASPNNCEESLRDKKAGNAVYFIKQVNKVTGQKVTVSRFTPVPSTTSNTKVVVDSMKITSVDSNGTDGSQGIAVLEVNFRKPTGNQLGGKVIKKEINLSANLCNKNYITATTFKGITDQCIGAGKKLIEPPIQWPVGAWFGVCQDCTVAGYKKINFCQSQGDGGVDVGAVSKLACINMGGTFDDQTQKCDIGNEAIKASCEALGGTFDEASLKCLIGDGLPSLQVKLCNLEKIVLGETLLGGKTTLCKPNVSVSGTALVNNKHTKSDCTGLGGSVMADSNGKNFCKFYVGKGNYCPTGWEKYNGWANYEAEVFFGSSQSYRLLCGHECGGQNCSVEGVSFTQNALAKRPSCNVGNCSFDCDTCCTRTTTWVTKYPSSTYMGCY